MTEKSEHFHGSDLEKIEEIYHIPKDEITSFAANVNPIGISPKLRATLAEHIDDITGYPEREYTSLRKCIGSYVNADFKNIIVGNGSTELISLFIKILNPQKALILGPSYSEYEREVTLTGGTSRYYRLDESNGFSVHVDLMTEQLKQNIDLLIMCNPNNPTSTAISLADMRRILDICKEYGIYVLVDETYVEFADKIQDVTAIPLAQYYNNIIILRGISKFFAAPGLRLGYAICGNRDLVKNVVSRQDPWTINTLAAIAGEIMFTDTDYIAQTRELISSERERICRELDTFSGLTYYKPQANFILLKILKDDVTAKNVFESAIQKKLMIRDCSDFPFLNNKYFRFCIMMPEKNNELIEVIRELLG
ncbi:MAG: aminotransferase class I/II-fold pyridoxal phosphate-dependent enzyme [Clostridia bacterium]|nr:histidinol-phosphate transaminase [Lachnospiraceae bacterium]NCC00389.1 aminotransferase class I/II-fold pyridoxal phosphate-dependent enzyme [Clostridia bacterium]NCD02588.1 aminotransferase class I/II-fold pyridoxal phosphate-dependent enzyme [Clostridia bacterium]